MFYIDSNKTNDLLYCAKSILLVKVYTDELVLQKEITLGGFVGVTDINLCNVQLPIIVDQKQRTKMVVGNFGTVGTTARATVESNETSNKNFVVFPSKFSLGSGEKTQLTIAYNPQITGKREKYINFFSLQNVHFYLFVYSCFQFLFQSSFVKNHHT